jgi:Mycothiol maleylpyruvate isomerase N-terminal domain
MTPTWYRQWDTTGVDDDGALDDLDRAVAGAQRVVAGIGAGQWTTPTPCTGLDVRTLVNHL